MLHGSAQLHWELKYSVTVIVVLVAIPITINSPLHDFRHQHIHFVLKKFHQRASAY